MTEQQMIDALRKACELTVSYMEQYYRDGRHPDLSPILRASKNALKTVQRD